MELKGYWFKDGTLHDLGLKKHIDMIIDNPEIFGLTKATVQKAYEESGEKLHFEGKAREYLIKQALENGWIRIRHYARTSDYWSIQFYDRGNSIPSVKEIVEKLLKRAEMYEDDNVELSDFAAGRQSGRIRAGDLAAGDCGIF